MEQRRLDLEDATKIRIVVLPIGNMDHDKFEYYCTLLSTFIEFELRNITIDYGKSKKNSLNLLKKRDWKTSTICFDFIKVEWAISDDWESLQFHRKVLGVVGILDCKQWTDLREASMAFQKKLDSETYLKDAFARMCLAVEPAEGQRDLDRAEGDNNTNFIMVPAQDEQRLQFYVKNLLLVFSSTILSHLENLLTVAEPSLLLTPQDTNEEAIESNKRQKSARFIKQQGDLCLLLGSPADAQDFYLRAVEQCKVHQDMLWVAAASEGIAASKLVEFNQKSPNWPKDKPNPPELADILAKANEATDLYTKKSAVNLQIELTIKLARLYIKIGDKLQSSNLIMKAYAESESLSIQEKITLTSTIALLYKEINMKRKFSFFLRETALLCKKIVLPQRAYHLLKMVAPFYQVHLPFSEYKTDEAIGKKVRRRDTLYASGIVWKCIHATLFDDLIEVASEMKDPKIPIRYLISYLSTLGRHLNAKKQIDLSNQLIKQTRRFPVMVATGSPGLLTILPVTSVAEVNHGGVLVEIEPQNDYGGPSGPFLYRPKRVFNSHTAGPETPIVKCSKGTPIIVRIHIQNHFHFNLELQQIELRAPGVICKPVQQLSFDALARKHVDFTITVLEGDIVKALTLHYRTFNCVHSQPVKMDTHIKVLDSLSVLKVVRVTPGGTKFKLFNGQETKIEFQLSNEGAHEIDFINVDVEETYEKPDENTMFRKKHKMIYWEDQIIKENLPLQHGAKFLLPFYVFAHASCLSTRLYVRYGNLGNVKDHQRSLEINLEWNIVTGLRLLSFDILECSADSLRRFKELPPHDDIIIDADEGFNEDDDQLNFCLAVFDVINQTPQPFHLECNKEKRVAAEHDRSAFFHSQSFVTIEPNAVRRVVVAMRRLLIHPENMPALDAAQKKFLIKEKGLTETKFDLFRDLQVYRDKLLERIVIHWHAITENSHGLLRLDSLTLSEIQLEHLKQSPICLTLFPLGKDGGSNVKDSSVRLHTLLNLGVKINKIDFENNSNDLVLSLLPCRLLSTLSFSWVHKINEVHVVEGKLPQFLVSFHERGNFQLIAHCKDVKMDKDYWSPPLEICVN